MNNPDSTKPVDLASMLGKPESLEVSAEDADTNRVFGILAYLGIFVLVPIIVAKDSPFAKYHSNQGLVLFLVEISISVILTIISIFIYSALPFAHVLTSLLEFVYLVPFGGKRHRHHQCRAGQVRPAAGHRRDQAAEVVGKPSHSVRRARSLSQTPKRFAELSRDPARSARS